MPINPHVDPDRLPKLAAAIGKGKITGARTTNNKNKKRRPAATQRLARPPPIDPDAFTIDQLCQRHGVSHSVYYRLKAKGLGPREIKLGTKVLITKEAAAEWRAAREAETAQQVAE